MKSNINRRESENGNTDVNNIWLDKIRTDRTE
jgi:hypothetical protein